MTVIGLVSNAMPARRFPAARRDMNTTVRLFYTFECSAPVGIRAFPAKDAVSVELRPPEVWWPFFQ